MLVIQCLYMACLMFFNFEHTVSCCLLRSKDVIYRFVAALQPSRRQLVYVVQGGQRSSCSRRCFGLEIEEVVLRNAIARAVY